jgi:hypothetical protein
VAGRGSVSLGNAFSRRHLIAEGKAADRALIGLIVDRGGETLVVARGEMRSENVFVVEAPGLPPIAEHVETLAASFASKRRFRVGGDQIAKPRNK